MRTRRHLLVVSIVISVVSVLAVIATLLTRASPVQRANEAIGDLLLPDGLLDEPHCGEGQAAGLVEEGKIQAIVNAEYREAHDAVEAAELMLRE